MLLYPPVFNLYKSLIVLCHNFPDFVVPNMAGNFLDASLKISPFFNPSAATKCPSGRYSELVCRLVACYHQPPANVRECDLTRVAVILIYNPYLSFLGMYSDNIVNVKDVICVCRISLTLMQGGTNGK